MEKNLFFFLQKTSTLIRVIKKNKKSTKERERERESTQFFCGKNMDWMGGIISTLIKVIKKNKNSTKERGRERERERLLRKAILILMNIK